VPESTRADFLMDVVAEMEQPLVEDARDLVLGAFRQSVSKVENPEWMTWQLQNLCSTEHDPALAREMLDVFAQRWGEKTQYKAWRVRTLCTEGRYDEALVLLFELYDAAGLEENFDDWETLEALQSAESALLEARSQEIVDHVIEVGERTGQQKAARNRCISLLRRGGNASAELDFLRRVLERDPDDREVLEQLEKVLKRDPSAEWERLDVLERIAALDEDDDGAFKDLAKFWKAKENPIEEARWDELAKAAKKRVREREKAEKAAEKARREAEGASEEGAVESGDEEVGEVAGDATAVALAPTAATPSAATPSAATPSAAAPSAATPTAAAPTGAVPAAPLQPAASAPASGSTSAAPTSGAAVPLASLTTSSGSTSTSSTSVSTVAVPAGSFAVLGGGSVTFSIGPDGELIEMGDDDGDRPAEKAPPATLKSVSEALAKDDTTTARAVYRRMWRAFRQSDDDGMFFYSSGADGFGGWNGIPQQWPGDLPDVVVPILDPDAVVEEEAADEGEAAEDVTDVADGAVVLVDGDGAVEVEPAEDEPAKKKEPKRRGGLDDFRIPTPSEQPRTFATYDVLVNTEFGRAEMERQLRTRNAQQLDHCQPLFRAIATRDRRVLGDEAAVDALIARFDEGRADRVDLELLLQHLVAGVGTDRDDVRALLDQLLTSVGTSDSAKLTEIARLLALCGRDDQCARLLPWCGSLATLSGRGYEFSGGIVIVNGIVQQPTGPVGVDALVAAARDTLEGEQRIETIA
ncbi:MAG: hypothetical protein R3F34_20945, partial [Planctomycetota bacterium]